MGALYADRNSTFCDCARHWNQNEKLGLTATGLRCLDNGNVDPLQCPDYFCYCFEMYPFPQLVAGPVDTMMMWSLPCYNSSIHTEDHTTLCEANRDDFHRANAPYDNGIVLGGSKAPVCGPDGMYSAVQPREEGGFFCSDRDGRPIEDFSFGDQDQSQCYCATRWYLMTSEGLTPPSCCADGRYRQRQTGGGFAYCVDGNGNQVGDAL